MQPVTTEAARGNDRNPQPLHAVQLADALLRIATVAQATGLSSATIYRKLAAGEFPEPVRLGARCTRWKSADVRAWIQAQGADQ
ncbi:helix-turn-helix transcriptional regulator [Roseateles sp.]|jgi:prophage regulatory protein|uniref:helix-turn-helix transcriptional regulator n=1 Tax=Roseateles sp. TaxID=1971397 RepID=UPI0037CC4B35